MGLGPRAGREVEGWGVGAKGGKEGGKRRGGGGRIRIKPLVDEQLF